MEEQLLERLVTLLETFFAVMGATFVVVTVLAIAWFIYVAIRNR